MRIDKITSISPSRFYRIKQCALSEVWSLSDNQPLVPVHANAILGTVVHKVLEKYSCERSLSFEAFEEVWNSVENRVIENLDLAEQWRYKPLSGIASYYFPKKDNTRKAVGKLSGKRNEEPDFQSLTEHKLKSPDGLIKGKADLILRQYDTGNVSIIDFKTGLIYNDQGSIKEEYVDQLLLYAALYNQNSDSIFGGAKEWPDRIAVVASDGSFHEIKYTREQALQCYNETRLLLNEINRIIESNPEVTDQLSKSGDHCLYCAYRPACSKYLGGAHLSEYDITGIIRSLFWTSDNKKVIVRFSDSDWIFQYFLSGFSAFDFHEGQKIAIANVRKERQGQPIAYSTRFTVIISLES
jgi:hypothetical protein